MRFIVLTVSACLTLGIAQTVHAFCGFYVAKADTSLFNRASQVVLVRNGDRTVITMANDFEGDARDFAVVVPVPTFIEREQIHVAEKALIDHLDAYTSPRLVEYFDPDPCMRLEYRTRQDAAKSLAIEETTVGARDEATGVTVEASYSVGEYDIQILSGEDSRGLIRWLNANGYRIPAGAQAIVGSYLRQDMRFFVAKVNVEAQARSGRNTLRPLQVAYESHKFMLPIRLGTLNADRAQELYVYTLTQNGRVETTNYRTVKLPSNTEVPEFVEAEFGEFYRALFTEQHEAQDRRAVFLEYAWDMGWCDPCAADPLSNEELRELGVFWVEPGSPNERIAVPQRAPNVFVTRLHLRYDAERFPEDLVLQETGDRQNFQGRYVIRHPFAGKTGCDDSSYRASVQQRKEREAQQLAALTGWDIEAIRAKIPLLAGTAPEEASWWRKLWN